ncbi:E3 ubiquitin-protein ligase MARCHF3 [Echeneis naucrates]|uniref:E3 ubiquitin-protein ligase MARCH3-like n=1 Tax=Echeneis naucrates TaxID=173247 RepID=A0A665TUJ3_ECHNA|nr:E3 ubiquitin-protein ligase MARCH3-like [Echeneis naucrates]
MAKEPLDPLVLNPVGEVRLMPKVRLEEELDSCSREVMDRYTDMPPEEHAAVTDSLSTEELFCRICHEGVGSGQLLSPCDCSGSLAMVHQACLEHWLMTSNSSHCELCHHQFVLDRLPKPLTEWLCSPSMQQQRRTLCGDAVCFLFITPLASLSGWLCVQGAMDLYYTNGMEALGLLVLTLALFTIYIFWTVVSVRYHIHLFRTWKKTDQRVRMQIPLCGNITQNQQNLFINTISKDTNKETMV